MSRKKGQGTVSHRYWIGEGDTPTGCEFGRCLECPLPKCKYDMTGSQVHSLRQWVFRDRPILEMLGQGMLVEEVAEAMKLTPRTVFRIKARYRDKESLTWLKDGREVASVA